MSHDITPGSSWEQCYIESFHDKLRDEFLNREIFHSLAEAAILLEGWRKEYNEVRIHSSLDYKTPKEFAIFGNPPLRATPSTASSRKNQRISTKTKNQQPARSTV